MADNTGFDWASLIAPAVGAGGALYLGNQAKGTANQVSGNLGNVYNDIAAQYNQDPTTMPGYQFGLDEGNRQINRAAAARGGYNSGNTLKALTKYGIDYNTAQNSQRQNQLMQLLGQRTSLANAQGAAQIAGSNAGNAGLTSALDIASKYLGGSGSGGKSNASNIYGAVGSGLASLFGGNQSSPSYDSIGASSDYSGVAAPSTDSYGSGISNDIFGLGSSSGSGNWWD